MNNRNPNTPSRERRDSISEKERHEMQQGYPVRDDATLSFDRPVNHPDGPREVPQSLRQGKIPVRKDANTGRTFPVMNRNGQKTDPVPQPVQEEPLTQTEPLPGADVPESDTAPEPVTEETTQETAPVPAVENQTAEPEAAPAAEEQAENTEPEPDAEEAMDSAESETDAEEPVDDVEPVPAADEAEENTEPEPADEEIVDSAEPNPAADEPEDNTEPVPTADEPVENAEPVPAADEPAENAEPVLAADEPVENAEPVPTADEPAENAEPVSAADEPAENAEPVSAADEPADNGEEADDEPIEPPLFVQRKRTAAVPPQQSEAPVQTADPLEATREFDKIPAAVPPVRPASPASEGTDSGNDGSAPKKLWILPLVVAVLAALGLCIGIPAAMSSRAGTVPDFDMSESYGDAVQETDPVDETGGAGREDVPETETEPPETLPPPVKFSVTLSFFDRDPIVVSTSEITLGSLLEKVNYTILDSDRFSVDLSTLLTEETTVVVDTVTYGTAKETVTIPFETVVTNVQTIPRGQRNVTQYGQNGTKTITYTTELVNGVEASRTVAREEITKQPVTETCQLGVGGTLVGNDGKTYSYSYYRVVNATYYDIEGMTYLGYNADESVVAVDMDYIPLGTKIYVKNDQFDFGVRTAADTGSMIEGWEVDIWLGDSNPQKAAFAQIGYVKNMVIYYLD